MNCQQARDVLPELLDRRTGATEHAEARTHLSRCRDCQLEFAGLSQTAAALDRMPQGQPSPRLRQNFYSMLEEEQHSAAAVRAVAERARRARRAPRWGRVLSPLFGCALIMLGFLLGQRSVPQAANPSPTPSTNDSTHHELLALRAQMDEQRKQLDKMTTLVGYSILQQQTNPANERLQGILAKARDAAPSDQDIDLLIKAVNLDPSANVRLRALEALYRHVDREMVRAGVLAALPREQNPLVQLELIDFVAAAQEQDAAPYLERMSADASTNRSVRNAAQLALARL